MKVRRILGILSGVVASLVVAGLALASDVAVTDYSTDIASGVVGLVGGVALSIGAVFTVAVLIRVTRTGARAALKAIGMIH